MSAPKVCLRSSSELLGWSHLNQSNAFDTPPISRSSTPQPDQASCSQSFRAGSSSGSQTNGSLAPGFVLHDQLRQSMIVNTFFSSQMASAGVSSATDESSGSGADCERIDLVALANTPEQKAMRSDALALALNKLEDLPAKNELCFARVKEATTTHFSGICRSRDINKWTDVNGFTRGEARAQVNSNKPLKYNDIVPWDHTLVASGDDFINANIITLANKSYIASEAPCPVDFYNFWLMVWNQSNVIVMLTELMEKRQIKAYCYWPKTMKESTPLRPSRRESRELEAINVNFKDCEIISPDVEFDRAAYDQAGKQYIVKYTFDVKKGESEKSVTLLHYRHLKDMAAPEDREIACFQRLLAEIDEAEKPFPANKTIVHCSAGVGRTGMVLGCRFLKAKREAGELDLSNRPLAVAQTVVEMRVQRDNLIQTVPQYSLVSSFADSL